MSKIDQIHSMLTCLPKKDYKLALQFLDKRQFVELKEIVDSNIMYLKKLMYRYSPKRDTTEPSERYIKLEQRYNIINKLKSEVDIQAQAFIDLYPEEEEYFNYYED